MLHHRVWAEIDLDALRHNYHAIRNRLAPGTRIMAVLKADAYGHGAVEVAATLAAEGVDAAGVGDSQEALELREAGMTLPILVLGAIVPGEMEAVIANDIHANILSLDMAREMNELAGCMGRIAKVQLLVDTGMGRLGIEPYAAAGWLRNLRAFPNLRLTGINTHFSSAGENDPAFTMRQLERFQAVVDAARGIGIRDIAVHAANHAAMLKYPNAHFDMVRPGLALYGLTGVRDPQGLPDLRRVLSVRTQIAFIKDVPEGTPISYDRQWYAPAPTRIATLPMGYNDGYRVGLSGKAEVLIRGRRAPVVGRISMDYVMADVGTIPGTAVGDIVTLIGRDGREEIRLEELAAKLATVPYEITCGLGKRVRRVYEARSSAQGRAA